MDTTVLDVDTSRDRIVDLTDAVRAFCRAPGRRPGATCSRRTPPRASPSSRPAPAPTTTSSTRSSACCRATTATATRTAHPGHGADHVLPAIVAPSVVVPVQRRRAAARRLAERRARRPQPRQPAPPGAPQLRGRADVTDRAPYLVSRLQGFGTTIFAEMSALAVATGSINLGQGFPDADGPPEVLDAAVAAIRAGHNQYPPGPGDPRAARRDRRAPGEVVRRSTTTPTPRCSSPRARPRPSRPRCSRCASRATRWSRSSPTTTRTPRASRWPVRNGSVVQLRTPDYSFDRRRARGARSRRARGCVLLNSPHNPTGKVFSRDELERGRAPLRGARPRRGHRRGLRAPRVRRRARPARDVPGDARPHRHDLVGRQDVLVHGLEDRLGVRVARAHRRGAHGEAVPHLRERRRRSSTASRSGSGCPTIGVPAGRGRAARRSATGLSAGLAAAGFTVLPVGRHLLRHRRHPSGGRGRRARVLPRRCPSAAVWSRSPASCSTTTSDAGNPLVRFACCKRLDVIDEAVARLKGLRAVKVAAVQHDIVWEDRDGQLRPPRADASPRPRDAGARLVVLTEMFATGFSMDTDRIAEPFDGPSAQFLVEQATRTACGCAARCPRCSPATTLPSNTLDPRRARRPVHRYRKIHPFTYGGEHEKYAAGDERVTVERRWRPLQLFVCYDLRFADEFWAARRRHRLLRRRRQLAGDAARPLAHAAARPGDREPGVRRRREPRRAAAAGSTTRATAR